MPLIYLSFLLLLLFGNPGTAFGQSLDHSQWATLLEKHVAEGVVNYAGFQRDYTQLQAYLKTLSETDTTPFSHEEKIAFYLNAYNANCIAGVLSHGQIQSVQDVWFFFKRTRFPLEGRTISLDKLEHEIIRPLKEPRIHFALVCAATSCPILRSTPYRSETLGQDLDEQGTLFLQDHRKNRLDHEKGILYLSSIFNWFAEDFLVSSPNLQTFVTPYLKPEDQAYLSQHQVRVEFLPYDWNLNGHF